MRILIAGGTGFIGSQLTEKLVQEQHDLFVLTRNPERNTNTKQVTYIEWLRKGTKPEKQLPSIDAVINLAGESLNSGRWNEKRKQAIMNSRIQSTRELIRIIQNLPEPPGVLIQASAIGYYGTSSDETFTENHAESGNDFLADVVTRWEEEAKKADSLLRTVIIRFGVVLGNKGGALPKMVLPYKWFIGGKVGTGRQWVSWIHVDDLVNLIDFSMKNSQVRGVLNGTAPSPVRNEEFGKTIGQLLHRPHWMPVPSFALRVLFGEMSLLLLEGQKVLPEKAMDYGFSFTYPKLDQALESILLNRKKN